MYTTVVVLSILVITRCDFLLYSWLVAVVMYHHSNL